MGKIFKRSMKVIIGRYHANKEKKNCKKIKIKCCDLASYVSILVKLNKKLTVFLVKIMP